MYSISKKELCVDGLYMAETLHHIFIIFSHPIFVIVTHSKNMADLNLSGDCRLNSFPFVILLFEFFSMFTF